MRSIVAFALLVAVAGCGGQGYYPVRGKVVFPDGSPLSGGWVVFEKNEGGAIHSADSPLKMDGSFELRSARPGDGAPVGKYRVLVKPPERTEKELQTAAPLLDRKFERFETSGIELIVAPQTNNFEIKVTKPKG